MSINKSLGCILILLCSGCVTTTHTSVDALGGYAVGMTFRTNQRLAVFEVDDGLAGRRFALVAIEGPRAPNARNHYSVDKVVLAQSCMDSFLCAKNSENITAVIPAGIMLTVVRIDRRKGVNPWFGRHDDIVVFANSPNEIMDIFSEVDMTDLSVLMRRDRLSADPDEVLYAPDPSLLSIVQ